MGVSFGPASWMPWLMKYTAGIPPEYDVPLLVPQYQFTTFSAVTAPA